MSASRLAGIREWLRARRWQAAPAALAALLSCAALGGGVAPDEAQQLGLPPYDAAHVTWSDAVRPPDRGDGATPVRRVLRRALGRLGGGEAALVLRASGTVLFVVATALAGAVLRARGAGDRVSTLAAAGFALHPLHVDWFLSSRGVASLLAAVLALAALTLAPRRSARAVAGVAACGALAALVDRSALALAPILAVDAAFFVASRPAAVAGSTAAALATVWGGLAAQTPAGAAGLLDLIASAALALRTVAVPWPVLSDHAIGAAPPVPSSPEFGYDAALLVAAATLAARAGPAAVRWCAFASGAWFLTGMLAARNAAAYSEQALVFLVLSAALTVAVWIDAGLRTGNRRLQLISTAGGLGAALFLAVAVQVRIAQARSPCALAAVDASHPRAGALVQRHDAVCAAARGDHDHLARRAASLAALRPEGDVLLAQALWHRGSAQSSAQVIARALGRGISFTEPVRDPALGALLAMARGAHDVADRYADRASRSGMGRGAVEDLRTLNALAAGRDEEALAHARARVAAGPDVPSVRGWVAGLLAERGNHREARRLLAEGVTRYSNDPAAFIEAIRFELVHGEPEQAFLLADRAWTSGVRLDAAALAGPIRACFVSGRFDRVAPLIRALHERDPGDPLAALFVAAGFERLGRSAEADAGLAALRAAYPALDLRKLLDELEPSRRPGS